MSHFEKCFEHVIGIEGGYVDHPADRGGPTRFGITLGTLKEWRNDWSLTAEDVKNLSVDEAKQIYKANYWDIWRLDNVLSESIALALFDQAVNWGPGSLTAKRVQRSINRIASDVDKVAVDGVIGPKTIESLNNLPPKIFLHEFISNTQDDYVALVKKRPSQIAFLAGWINRTQELFRLLIKAE